MMVFWPSRSSFSSILQFASTKNKGLALPEAYRTSDPSSEFKVTFNNVSSTGKSWRPAYEATSNQRSLNHFSDIGPPPKTTRSIRISSGSDEFLCSLRPRLDGALERFRMTTRIYEHCKRLQPEPDMAHQIIPALYFTSVSMNDPSWSTTLDMLKVESTPATVRLSKETAMCLPGHILFYHLSLSSRDIDTRWWEDELGTKTTYLRPNPNAINAGSRMFGSSWPLFKYRSGLKDDGSG